MCGVPCCLSMQSQQQKPLSAGCQQQKPLSAATPLHPRFGALLENQGLPSLKLTLRRHDRSHLHAVRNALCTTASWPGTYSPQIIPPACSLTWAEWERVLKAAACR